MFGRKRKRQLDHALEALRWYADEANWRRRRINAPGQPRQWAKSPAAGDRGMRARRALAGNPPWSAALWRAGRESVKAFIDAVDDVSGDKPKAPLVVTVPPPRPKDEP